MDAFFDAFGPTTRRIAGEAASQMTEAGLAGTTGRFKKFARGLEEGRYRRAFYGGLKKFYPEVWQPEVPAELASLLPPDVVVDLQKGLGTRVQLEDMHGLVNGLAGDSESWVDVYRYLDDPDALSPGLVVELEGRLNGARSVDEAHVAINDAAEAVRARAANAFAVDPTPPGRRTWGKFDVAQDFWEEKSFTEALGEQFGMPPGELQAQIEDYRRVMAEGDAALRQAGEEMAAAVGAEYDEGAGQLARYYSGEVRQRKLETRAQVDALRQDAWARVKAGDDATAVWPGYFAERNRLWQEAGQFGVGRLQAGLEGMKRLGGGDTVEAIIGRPLEDVVRQSMEQLQALGREMTARQRRLQRAGLEDFLEFDKMLEARRLGVDTAEAEMWRRVAMNPGQDALEIALDADARVWEMGQAAAHAQEQALLELKGGRIKLPDYRARMEQVWGQYFTDAPQVYGLGMAQASELPMSAGAQQRALVNMGWPPGEVEALSGAQRQAALAAGVRWDSLVGGPEMPIEQAMQGTVQYVVERSGMDMGKMADWSPEDWQRLGVWAKQLGQEAGDRASQAQRVTAAAFEGAAEAAAAGPQRVTAGMELAWPASVDDVARSMGLQPKMMTADDWHDVAAFCQDEGSEYLALGTEEGRWMRVHHETPRVAAGYASVGREHVEVTAGARSWREMAARERELKWLGREDAQQTAG
jgi:hypothetical protein